MSDFYQGLLIGAIIAILIFVIGIWFNSLDDEIDLIGIGRFVRVGAEVNAEKDSELSEWQASNLCQTVDAKFKYFTNDNGVRCTRRFGNGVVSDYVFSPFEHWQGVYELTWTVAEFPDACDISSSECGGVIDG